MRHALDKTLMYTGIQLIENRHNITAGKQLIDIFEKALKEGTR